MTTQEKSRIIEWLYCNDENYKSATEWRKAFVKMLGSDSDQESPESAEDLSGRIEAALWDAAETSAGELAIKRQANAVMAVLARKV